MKVLVTGGAGFIGSHLVEYLLTKGHSVSVLDNLQRGQVKYVSPQAEFILGDIRDRNIGMYLKNIDWVFHTAAVATTPDSVSDPVLTNDINVSGTLNLLMAARKTKVKRFIYSSSNVVYSPHTPYFVSKVAAENYCRVFTELYGLSTISLRYSNVYGSLRANPKNSLMALWTSSKNKGYLEITGDGKQSRDFTHVKDIIRANLLAAKSKVVGEIDICTGVNTSLNTIAHFFPHPIHYLPERQGDIKHIIQNPETAKKLLGFTARIKFSDGMKIYL